MERDHRSLIRAALRQRRSRLTDSGQCVRYGNFAALRHGMSSLVSALSRRLPPQSIQLASPVDRAAPLDGGRWSLSIGGPYPRKLEVDGVVIAVPAYRAARMLNDVDFELSRQLLEIEYASCAVVALGYRRSQIDHPLDGTGFVVPLVERRTVFSCSFASMKYAGRAPNDSVLLRVFIGGACQRGLLNLSNDELVELATYEVGHLLRIRGNPILSHVSRHDRAMAQYHVGHRNRVAEIHRRMEQFSNLSLAGNAYGGVGIPACIQSGRDAANQMLSRIGTMKVAASNASIQTSRPHISHGLAKANQSQASASPQPKSRLGMN
jgi:oxygen-dependent protoporphyrinogen oxidase